MSVHLSVLTGSVDVDLSDFFGSAGVGVTLRRLTATQVAEARDRALSALVRARQGLDALAAYGFDGEDTNGVRLNVADFNQMTGVGAVIGAVELGMASVISWRGFTIDQLGDDGQPVLDGAGRPVRIAAPIDRRALAVLMSDDAIQRRLLAEIEKAARILVAEGNGFGSSPGGSSAADPGTHREPTTAPTAEGSASPARRGSRTRPRAPSARKSKTGP